MALMGRVVNPAEPCRLLKLDRIAFGVDVSRSRPAFRLDSLFPKWEYPTCFAANRVRAYASNI
jgi:hypothetical protein